MLAVPTSTTCKYPALRRSAVKYPSRPTSRILATVVGLAS